MSAAQTQVTKAAGVVGFATMITRISGFVRDMIVASKFGARTHADAFFVAFRIPNMLRRLVGEGALTVAFIPVFMAEREKGEEEAWALANAVMTLMALLLLGITVGGMALAPYIVDLLAPGYHAVPEKFALTVRLTRINFPYIFFISLAALAMGILNSLQNFFASALAPLMLNLAMIASVLWLCPLLDVPVEGLGIGVVLGGMMQLGFQLPALWQRGFRWRLNFDYHNPAVRKIALLMLPGFFSLAVNQIAVLISTFLASYLPEGSVSYLYYANRLQEFPLGIFCMAVATAVLPTMSAQSAKGDYKQLAETLSFALRLVFFITMPAMIGLIVLRVPIVALLFERGEFTPAATAATADALLYYTVGLCAIAGVRIIVPVFYALKDTVTPVKWGVVAVASSIGLSFVLLKPLQHGGLALATSLASYVNLIALILVLRKRLGQIGWRGIFTSAVKVTAAALLMGASCLPFIAAATQHGWLLAPVIVGATAVFVGGAWLFKSDELIFLLKLIRQKIKRRL